MVLLGDRFGWCSDVQAVWTTYESTFATLLTVEANYEAAIADYEASTDELTEPKPAKPLKTLGAATTNS